jgi:hypothetical protein
MTISLPFSTFFSTFDDGVGYSRSSADLGQSLLNQSTWNTLDSLLKSLYSPFRETIARRVV